MDLPYTYKRFAQSLFLGLLIAPLPIKFEGLPEHRLSVGFSFAHAESGSGSGGEDNSGSGSEGDDNSGSGGGGDDNSGSGNGSNDATQDDNTSGSRSGDQTSRRMGTESNIEYRYTNGWQERVLNGRYRLTDPKGRIVKDRFARPDDLTRIHKAAQL